MTHVNTEPHDIWDTTIGGRPRIGAVAERARRTSMNDVVMFSEMTGDRHAVSENASKTAPAKLLAVFVVDTGEKELTTPLEK